MLANLAFKSMDVGFDDNELKSLILKALKEKKNLASLFKAKLSSEGVKLTLGDYEFIEERHVPVAACIQKGGG
jgi:hypothetical protein